MQRNKHFLSIKKNTHAMYNCTCTRLKISVCSSNARRVLEWVRKRMQEGEWKNNDRARCRLLFFIRSVRIPCCHFSSQRIDERKVSNTSNSSSTQTKNFNQSYKTRNRIKRPEHNDTEPLSMNVGLPHICVWCMCWRECFAFARMCDCIRLSQLCM